MKSKISSKASFLGACAVLSLHCAHAANYYWDIDGATAGAGGITPSGTWSAGGSTWSTDATGAAATSAVTTTLTDDLFFSAGDTAGGAYVISLSSTQSAKSLTFEEGNATISGASGIITLGGTGDIRVVTNIANATIGNNTSTIIDGTAGLTKLGAGTLTLNGSAVNPFTGGIRVNGGTLALNFSNLATPTDLVDSGNLLTLGGGGNVSLTGKATGTTNQTFNGVTVAAGGGSILGNKNGGTALNINLGAITATATGGSLILGGTSGNLPVITTSSTNDATGILGGRIVYFNGTAGSGYDFATATAGTVGAYTGYTAFTASGTSGSVNYRLQTAAITGVTTQSVNTLKIIGVNLTQGAGTTLTFEGGGLISSSTAGTVISGGSLTAGNGTGSYDLNILVGGTGGGQMTLTSNVVDNSGNSVSLVKTGPGTLILNSAKGYTGSTYVNQGILDFATFTPAGTGRNIHVAPGALVKFASPSTALLNRIAQTDEEIGIITASGSSAAIDFSATGANLPNAFLAGGWFSNGAKNDNFTGTITPANNTYRIGFTGAAGSFGMSSLLGGANDMIIGGNNVILTNANTYTGETVVRTGASLLLANTLAVQNSALNLGNGADTIGGLFALSRLQQNVINDKLVTSATLGGLIGSRNLATAYGGAYGNNAGVLSTIAVRSFTLNPESGESYAYSGAIANFTRDTTITKTGVGTQELGGNNSYSGVTTISDGVLKLGHAAALGKGGSSGASAGSTIVSSGATLDLNGVTSVVEPIILNGTGVGGNGALINNSASAASIVAGIASVQITSGGTYTGTAPTVSLSGSGTGATATVQLGLSNASLAISGGSGWVVGDLFTTSGGAGSGAVFEVTSIGTGGTITGKNLINAGSGYTTAPTAITKLSRTGTATGTLTISYNLTNNVVGGITLTNGGSGYDNTTTATFSTGGASATVQHSSVVLASDSSVGGSGDIAIGAVVSETGGSRSLTKVGAGTLTLSATNTYTGATIVDEGTLVIAANGSTHSSSSLTVADGATLAGKGTINGAATISGILSPGSSPGVLSFGSTLALTSTAVTIMEIDGAAVNDEGVRGTDFDGVDVTGALTYSGALTLVFGNTFEDGTYTFDLFDFGSESGDFVLVTLGGDYSGSLSLVATDTWQRVEGDNMWTFTQNDGILSLTVIPEPGTALLSTLSLLALLRRRRK